MAAADLVGLFASTTQLAAYAINITTTLFEIYHRIRDAPKRIQDYIRRINQLLTATHLIESHTLLQTKTIRAQVGHTLYQAQQLSAVLQEARLSHCYNTVPKVWSVLNGRRDKEIADSFERLEQEKSTLLMSIQIAHTDILGNIQINLDKFVGNSVPLLPESEKKTHSECELLTIERGTNHHRTLAM